MLVKRFHGGTIAQAYEEVRSALGEDALIVTTESTTDPDGGSTFEVVAALEDGEAPVRPGLGNDAAAHDLVRTLAEETAAAPQSDPVPFVNPFAGAGLAKLRRPGSLVDATDIDFDDLDEAAIAPALADAVAAAVETGERDLLGSIAERMRSVEESLHRMSHQRANALASEGPVELQELRHKFIDHGVNAHVLALLIERLAEGVRPTLSALQVARAAERVLSTLLPPTPRLDFGVGSGPLVVFVVGPHGAGKTSVALKLAHDYAEAQAGRAIMVGTDVGRAGAPQQLLAAAAAAQVDAQLCYTPGELRSLVRSQPSGLLIVDTPAPAVGRRDEMLELTTFAQVAPRRATLLALPAWLGAMDAQRATSMFAPLGLTGLVATHVDQAMSFGGVVSAAIQSSIGVAYTSASDGLTDGLSTGDNHALAIAVLTGAWPRVPAAAPEGALSGFRS